MPLGAKMAKPSINGVDCLNNQTIPQLIKITLAITKKLLYNMFLQ